MPVLRTTQGHEEFEEARKEGIRFVTRRGPMRFVGNDHLAQIELRAVTSVFDAAGRFAPQYDDSDVMTLEADGCVLAIGQRADLSFLKPADQIELTPVGGIKVDSVTLATTASGVYAGGDVAFGPRNLIEATASARHDQFTNISRATAQNSKARWTSKSCRPPAIAGSPASS
jgi:NADPH-dependent glutamate synthase beta subunit-like oxidoreductase